MKVALSLDINDNQRKELACRIAGKSVARLATREEVREFVAGCIGSLSVAEDRDVQTVANIEGSVSRYTPDEQLVAERLRREGKSESYIRGWITAGRKR